ncbi:MAG: tetratricopeptide repeat protein [Pseudomonadota bacterium]
MSTPPAGDAVRLSQSDLWQRQKSFYCREGVAAWQGKVPFYATSNAFIANAYAQMILAYMQDTAARTPGEVHLTFPIVEVGAGPGIFAFHLVQRLKDLLALLDDPRLRFTYVLTDVAQRNLDFWCHHPAWESHIESGLVDFAALDLLTDTDPPLELAGAPLSSLIAQGDGPRTPMIALANYVFDSIPTDVFRVESGVLEEGRVPPSPTFEADYPENYSVTLEDINSPLTFQRATLPYYADQAKDAVVQRYLDSGREGYLCMPIAAMEVIDKLTALAERELLLISSDKAYSGHAALYAAHEPELAFHNEAHSIMVNFEALGEYCRARGGDVYHQRTQQGLATSAFLLGKRLDALPRTRLAVETHLNGFSPGDLFRVSAHLADTSGDCPLEVLVAHMNLLRWDPELFNQHLELILSEVREVDASVWKDLADGARYAATQVYQVPETPDTLMSIGCVLQEMELYDDALACFERSRAENGENALASYHMGLCYLGLEDNARAVSALEASVAMNPDDVTVKGWLMQAREWLAEQEQAPPRA